MVTPFSTLAPLAGTNIPSFTFATSSEQYGTESHQIGKYPVKLYNSSSVLIYQEEKGIDNSGKLPSGGVLALSIVASSMSVAITNPITFYWGAPYTVINQDGQSSDLYNYYWSSYSRGVDGDSYNKKPLWHNDYLDSYIPLRHKSIYDPCPYGYRTPSNGTYHQFANPRWTSGSYVGGASWDLNSGLTWLVTTGDRSSSFRYTGYYTFRRSATTSDDFAYSFGFYPNGSIYVNYVLSKTSGYSVRCIEDCSVVSDATEASAGY